MIKVHHLENSRSQRVIWLLEELGASYEIITYQRDPRTQRASNALKRVHPLGKSPVISDTDQQDRVVAESAAILDYLVDRFDDEKRLRPAIDSEAGLRYRFWMHHAEGSAMPPLLMRLVMSQLGKPPVPALIRPIARGLAKGMENKFLDPEVENLMHFWEGELNGRDWFTGDDFSAADIQMSFPLLALDAQDALEDHPRLAAVIDSFRDRPAYRRTVEKVGEFSVPGG